MKVEYRKARFYPAHRISRLLDGRTAEKKHTVRKEWIRLAAAATLLAVGAAMGVCMNKYIRRRSAVGKQDGMSEVYTLSSSQPLRYVRVSQAQPQYKAYNY